jgi:N-acetylglucosamine-6-phosphate deacetylase
MLYIHNATILTPEHQIDEGALLTDGLQIAAVGPAAQIPCPASAHRIDGTGLLLAPGFIELQINGAFGNDLTFDPASIWTVAAGLPRYGVTAFLATIITSPLETVATAQAVVVREPAGFGGSQPLGLHVEGPFLNPLKKGAHNPANLRLPELDAVRDWSPERGVRLVTLAPELPGALEMVEALEERGVIVSAGHSVATYEQSLQGFEAGIRYGTHLYNGMPSPGHRAPGLAGALLTDPRPVVGLIVDGIHSHPAMVDLAWRALGSERLSLVTDAMAALGMPPGRHRLAEFEVEVDHTGVHLPDGTLAGSLLSLDAALRNLMALTGCKLAEALPAVTTTPAGLLGLGSERGRIAPGYRADLVLLGRDLDVRATVVAGQITYLVADRLRESPWAEDPGLQNSAS